MLSTTLGNYYLLFDTYINIYTAYLRAGIYSTVINHHPVDPAKHATASLVSAEKYHQQS